MNQKAPTTQKSFLMGLRKVLSSVATVAGLIAIIWSQSDNWQNIADQVGLRSSLVAIAGTGSMAPTFAIGSGETPEERAQETVGSLPMWRFPGGVEIRNWRLWQHELAYGDLVFIEDSRASKAESEETRNTNGLLKRVIGLPGDLVELRDGFVWRNGERLIEPYTLQPRSTYGGTSLAECRPTRVPEDSIFILGDNRKQSDDSRFELGFVPFSSVIRYFPWEKQSGYLDTSWRTDAARDAELSGTVSFNVEDFVSELNDLRAQQGQKPLRVQNSLQNMAQTRASQWLLPESPATDSGTLIRAANRAGYRNPLLAELPVSGFYTSQELLQMIQEVSSWSEILLRGEYDDIGVAVELSTNECPKQSIVIALGGYTPAEYEPAMVTSWEAALSRLQEVRPGWAELVENQDLSEEQKIDAQEIVSIINTRIQRIESLVRAFRASQWLTPEQERWLQEDANLAERQFVLSQQLNSQ